MDNKKYSEFVFTPRLIQEISDFLETRLYPTFIKTVEQATTFKEILVIST